MKKIMTVLIYIITLLNSTHAATDHLPLESVGVELKLETIEEATAAIDSLTQTAQPFTDNLLSGLEEMNSLIEQMQNGTTDQLTLSRLEKSMSGHMNTIIKGIDDLIAHEQPITWACEDIENKVKRLGKRIAQKHEQMTERLDRQKLDLLDYRKRLKELQTKISRANGKEKNSLDREAKALTMKINREVTLYKNRVGAQRLQMKVLDTLVSRGSTFSNLGQNVQDFYTNIKGQRNVLREVSMTRKEVLEIGNIYQAQLQSKFGQINDISHGIEQFSNVLTKLANLTNVMTYEKDVSDDSNYAGEVDIESTLVKLEDLLQ